MKKVILLISVFLCGACVMAMELAGARILAPFVGATITVWTSLIGVILGAMSLGYVIGGKLADKNASIGTFSMIIGLSGLSLMIVGLFKNAVLVLLLGLSLSNNVSALIAAITLFVIPSFLLAMVSPYALKLSMNSIEESGRTVGSFYAVSTIGSIIGTFLTGFYLIPSFGSTTIIIGISITLMILSLIVYFPLKNKSSIIIRILILSISLASLFTNKGLGAIFQGIVAEEDTQYGTILIIDNNNVRSMYIDNTWSSAMYLDSDELVFEYMKLYDLANHFNPDVTKTLALGGAGYSYPKYFINKYPDKEIDVVEIDPKTTELAQKYFKLTDNPRMTIFHDDARIFLNNNEIKYDAIFGDAFSASSAPPFQLVTKEANERIYNGLTDNGVYIINTISALEGDKSKFFRAYYHTLSQTFSQVLVFIPKESGEVTDVRNITLVALKKEASSLKSENEDTQKLLDKIYAKTPEESMILTDEYAPIEFLAR